MKIECVKEKLKEIVSTIEKVPYRNLPAPILGSVYFSSQGSKLKIKTTNLDIGVEVSTPVKVYKSGTVVIPITPLSQFLSFFKGNQGTITLEVIGNNLHIYSPKNSTSIKTISPDDFPTIPKISQKDGVIKKQFKTQEFWDNLRCVWYAASTSDIKPEISSVFIEYTPDDVVFVATDSFRLAEKRMPVRQTASQEHSIALIPQKNISDVIKIFDEVGGDIDIQFTNNQISFQTPDIYITSRLIDGVYPDYKQIIPKKNNTEVVVMKQDLFEALKISSVFSDKFNQVTFTVIPKDKVCEISSQTNDIGETTSKIDATLSGEDVTVSFNGRYILDALPWVPGDSVLLGFNGKERPLFLQDTVGGSFRYLVMPLNR